MSVGRQIVCLRRILRSSNVLTLRNWCIVDMVMVIETVAKLLSMLPSFALTMNESAPL